jgi:hypothetical protein
VKVRKLLQQHGDQQIKAPTRTESHLGDKSDNTSQTANQHTKINRDSTPYSHVKYSRMKNLKQCKDNTTGKNMESLTGIMYEVALECLMAAIDLLPGLGTLLYGTYSVWNWSVQMTEFVNRNQLALCTKKFIEKKFWDWIDREI